MAEGEVITDNGQKLEFIAHLKGNPFVTQEELFEAAKPLMKLLNERFHPQYKIIVNPSYAEVLEGICFTEYTDEFLQIK